MKVTNKSNAVISDEEILAIAYREARVEVKKNTREIIITEDMEMILVDDVRDYDFRKVGSITETKQGRWRLE